ncbi:MAG: hypothetical protein NC489_40030, partial [Ruminococcus flavefaciens]|nr:hypothetical protein [Ruminococcus flavefaciens]
HQVLQEKVPYVEAGGRGSRVIRPFYTLIVISRNGMLHSADTVFLIHFPDFFLDIGEGVICDLEQFGVLPEAFDVSGCNLFAVADSCNIMLRKI